MSLLHMLSYVGAAAAFIFITLSLASGLLWISELIEEHSRLAKTVGQKSIFAIIALHVLLYYFDSLPLKHILFSTFCHVVYLQNFTSNWPFISLTSISFIASCTLAIANHFLWFFHFAKVNQEARVRTQRTYIPKRVRDVPGFADIATFFGLCVWLVPLFLFLSLSANDNTLPMNAGTSSLPVTPTRSDTSVMTRTSLFKSLYDSLPRIRPRPRRRDTSEGIIAPRSPNILPPSPLKSPSLLPRVPSMNSLPPPLLSPTRRATSDGYPLSARFSPEPFGHRPSDRLAPFTLGSPPQRAAEISTPAQRLGIRRTSNAYNSKND